VVRGVFVAAMSPDKTVASKPSTFETPPVLIEKPTADLKMALQNYEAEGT